MVKHIICTLDSVHCDVKPKTLHRVGNLFRDLVWADFDLDVQCRFGLMPDFVPTESADSGTKSKSFQPSYKI